MVEYYGKCGECNFRQYFLVPGQAPINIPYETIFPISPKVKELNHHDKSENSEKIPRKPNMNKVHPISSPKNHMRSKQNRKRCKQAQCIFIKVLNYFYLCKMYIFYFDHKGLGTYLQMYRFVLLKRFYFTLLHI